MEAASTPPRLMYVNGWGRQVHAERWSSLEDVLRDYLAIRSLIVRSQTLRHAPTRFSLTFLSALGVQAESDTPPATTCTWNWDKEGVSRFENPRGRTEVSGRNLISACKAEGPSPSF